MKHLYWSGSFLFLQKFLMKRAKDVSSRVSGYEDSRLGDNQKTLGDERYFEALRNGGIWLS